MKKIQKRKLIQGRTYSLLVAIVCAIFILYSCNSDDNSGVINSEKGNKELTKKVAKEWYGRNSDSIISIKVIGGEEGILAKLDWSRAQEYNNEENEVVEIPLIGKQPVLLLDKETRMRIDWEKDKDKIRNLVRMVIVKNLENDEINNFITIYIGSYDYMLTNKTFSENNYLSLKPDYDGTVLLVKPNGGLIDGKIYENGKFTKTILPGKADNMQLKSLMDCWQVTEYYQSKPCEGNPNPYDPSYVYSFEYHKAIIDCLNDEWGSFVTVCEGKPYEPEPDDNGGVGGAEPKPGTNPVQAGPCTLTEWAEEDESPSKYYAKGIEYFAKNNLPITMEKQSYKTCITGLMEYINNHVYKKNKTKDYFNTEYIRVYNEELPDGGIDSKRVFGFMNKQFRTGSYSSIQSAIRLGCVVMLDYHDSWTYEYPTYPVLVIGYQANGNLIYMDPIQGELYTITEAYFLRNYIICIFSAR